MKIAVSGKGGVGKTTVCAVWAQLFAEDRFDVIAVDADPDTNLCSAFGISHEHSPTPLIQMKQLLAERTGTDKDTVGAYFKLNPNVSDLPEKYCVDLSEILPESETHPLKSKLSLLVLGGITQAGSGCACPEGVFLKALLTHAILQRKEVILVDLPAGVEFMGRASVQGIDALVVVIEPGTRSIETAANIVQMARQLNVKHVAGIINKVTDPADVEAIRLHLNDLIILGHINYHPEIQRADLYRNNVGHACPELAVTLRGAKNTLTHLIKVNADYDAVDPSPN